MKYKCDTGDKYIDISSLLFWKQCLHEDCGKTNKFYFFNGIKKNSFSILPYECSHGVNFNRQSDDYVSFLKKPISVRFFDLETLSEDLHKLQDALVTDYSQMLYKRAKAEFLQGDYYQTIDYAKKAVEDSFFYKDARYLLIESYIINGRNDIALDSITEYLSDKQDYFGLDENDLFFLEKKRNILLDSYDEDAAEEIYLQIVFILKEYNKIKESDTEEEIQTIIDNYSEKAITEEFSWNKLPYDVCWNFITQKKKSATLKERRKIIPPKISSVILIYVFSLLLSFLFYAKEDLLMSISTLVFGIFWGFIVLSNYKMYNLILESRHNIDSFINKLNFDEYYNDLLVTIFGDFQHIDKQSVKKLISLLIGSFLLTILMYHCTMFKLDGNENKLLNSIYFIYIYLVNLDLIYLFHNLICYNSAINSFRKENIEYSISQHPKFSIRYISELSRKISYRFVWVFIIFCFLMFLSPIKSNTSYILIFVSILGFIAYINITSYKIINNVISENKRKVLAKFSTHFEVPFNQFILKGNKESYDKVTELVEMRKFIESININGDSKLLLFIRGLIFTVVIISVMSFSSISMTTVVTPKISDLDQKLASRKLNQIHSTSYKVDTDVPKIELLSEDVDDSVIMIYFSNIEELDSLLIETDFYGIVMESEQYFENLLSEDKDKDKLKAIFEDYFIQFNNNRDMLDISMELLSKKIINEFNFESISQDVSQNLEDLKNKLLELEYTLNKKMGKDFFIRNDWVKGGDSPRKCKQIDMNCDSLFIISLAYNKVYIPPAKLMGGGKLSFKINIDLEDHNLVRTSRFIRSNVFGLGFVSILKLVKHCEKNTVVVKEYRGYESLYNFMPLKDKIDKITLMMSEEKYAKVSL